MAEKRNPGGNPTGLIQSLKSQGENSLLRAEVIDRLVRVFISRLLSSLDDFNEGRISRALSVATAQSLCGYYAGVLSGTTELAGYTTDSYWHPSGLANFLRGHMSGQVMVTASDEDVIAEALAAIASLVYKTLDATNETQETAINSVISYAIGLLRGIAA